MAVVFVPSMRFGLGGNCCPELGNQRLHRLRPDERYDFKPALRVRHAQIRNGHVVGHGVAKLDILRPDFDGIHMLASLLRVKGGQHDA